MLRADSRIPLRFGSLGSQAVGETVLLDADIGAPQLQMGGNAHPVGCMCCFRPSPEAGALARLFRRRATGQEAWFTGVLAVVNPSRQAAIRAALQNDPLVSGRFRLTDHGDQESRKDERARLP